MTTTLRLFWLNESRCHAGTVVRAASDAATQASGLEPDFCRRLMELSAGADEIDVHLPFLDRREWRKRGEILAGLPLERMNGTIRCVLPPAWATRDLGATLSLTDPAWLAAPREGEPSYFPVWRGVSVALQRFLRTAIAAEYFRDIARYQDRPSAYPMVVYSATRLCYGRPRTEFTYDFSDYPECRDTLEAACKMIGNTLQAKLAGIETTLREAGLPALSRRYAPVWFQDVLLEVRKKPQPFVALLAGEAALINALINLGTGRSATAVNRFSKTANRALRNVYGMDLRWLGVKLLEEATRALSSQQTARGVEDFLDRGIPDHGHMLPARSPELRIGD